MKQTDVLIKSLVDTVLSETSRQIAAGIYPNEVLAHLRLLNQNNSTWAGK
jgi:hypothetical protein